MPADTRPLAASPARSGLLSSWRRAPCRRIEVADSTAHRNVFRSSYRRCGSTSAQPHFVGSPPSTPTGAAPGAVVADHVLRHHGVAERLGHLAARFVDDEAAREHRSVRAWSRAGPTSSDDWNQPRTIRAFEYMSAGQPEFGALSAAVGARVEPHVENVAPALERRAAARRAGESRRHERLHRMFVPGVGTVLGEDRGRALDDVRGQV